MSWLAQVSGSASTPNLEGGTWNHHLSCGCIIQQTICFSVFPNFWVIKELIHRKVLEIMTNPVAVRTLWAQLTVFKDQFSIKRARSPKRNDDSRSGSGNGQIKIRIYCHPKTRKLSKSTPSMSNLQLAKAASLTCLVYKVVSKRLGRLFNKLPLAQGQLEHHNKYINIHTILWH